MAEFVEEQEYTDDEPKVVAETQQTAPQEVQQVEEDLPEKYKGKDLKEIIRMHQEAEKLIGRQGSEVGELRKVVDDFIRSQQKPEKVEEEPEVDFFEDPKKAVAKAIESNPAIQEARKSALELKKIQTLNRLEKDFPGFTSTVQDPDFAEWIKASPVRLRLYAAADADFDYDSAAELLNTWTAIKGKESAKADNKQAVEAIKKQTLKAATVDSGNTGVESKKIYRRADIIKLMQTDPDRYDAMQDEIMAAYRENRVR
jgi:hypothetical protein